MADHAFTPGTELSDLVHKHDDGELFGDARLLIDPDEDTTLADQAKSATDDALLPSTVSVPDLALQTEAVPAANSAPFSYYDLPKSLSHCVPPAGSKQIMRVGSHNYTEKYDRGLLFLCNWCGAVSIGRQE